MARLTYRHTTNHHSAASLAFKFAPAPHCASRRDKRREQARRDPRRAPQPRHALCPHGAHAGRDARSRTRQASYLESPSSRHRLVVGEARGVWSVFCWRAPGQDPMRSADWARWFVYWTATPGHQVRRISQCRITQKNAGLFPVRVWRGLCRIASEATRF